MSIIVTKEFFKEFMGILPENKQQIKVLQHHVDRLKDYKLKWEDVYNKTKTSILNMETCEDKLPGLFK